jgi:plastocyanin
MKTIPPRIGRTIGPLLALCLSLGMAGIGIAATAPPEATPAAACQRAATPAATPGAATATPAPIDKLTAADFAMISNSVTVRMTPNGFEPRAFQHAVGNGVDATLINTDVCEHTFTIDKLDIDVTVPAGEIVHVAIPSSFYGDYPFHSHAPGDNGPEWTGLLRVYL